MDVVVDDRERGAGVIAALRRFDTVRVTVARLKVGDYLVDNRVLFERKTVRDFRVSLIDGRLFGQARRMVSSPYRPAYIIESNPPDVDLPEVSRESVQGALIMLSIVLHIPVLRSRDSAETAWLIHRTADQLKRTIDGAVHRPGYRPRGKKQGQLYILQSLPEVGPKRAQSLLDRFGTIEAVMAADRDDLTGVPGIGEPIADKILNVVKESRAEYGIQPSDDLFPSSP
ncbi:MAG: helix-hairpin-helix domain-containing protein [Verrucomicrobia bacterium]|nr:helix-hairpin-helix domain-containing protein [Verrucomicrobiota bacterium]MDA1086698.1 helix-hairpin-helix domain-containing protein [Verrucomicrobiota bacterium]